STGRAAATATTTPHGSFRNPRPLASCSESAAAASRRMGSSPRERRLPLLQALSRRRPRRCDGRLRGDPRHQPAGAGSLARPVRATRRLLPRDRRLSAGGGEANARVRRRRRCTRGVDGLPCRGQCRSEGGPDGLPSSLAHQRRLGVSLIEEIDDEVKDAMRAGDAERRDTLRLILNSLKNSEKELQRPLSEEEELQVLQRERKKRVEAAEAFRAGDREEQADAEERELEILEEFMPEPLSEDEIDEIVDDVIAEVGASSMADLGRGMADVMPQIAGRADGSQVSQIVREKLA